MQNVLAVYVRDRPGVLNRVASLFRRRGFNIESLAVGHTEVAGISRMTIGVDVQDGRERHLEANLYKLSDVVLIENLTRSAPVAREMALIKVPVMGASSARLMSLTETFRAKIVDFTNEAVIIEICHTPETIDELVDALRPLRILEMVRSGQVVLASRSKVADACTHEFKSGN